MPLTYVLITNRNVTTRLYNQCMSLTLLLYRFSHLESVFYIFVFFTVENDSKKSRNVRNLM